MNVPPYGDTFKRALLHLANLRVRAQHTPDMTIRVSAGGFWYYTSSGASYLEFAGGNSSTITTPSSPNNRWTVIALTTTGTIVTIDGTAAASPVLPAVPRGRFPLAAIYILSLIHI